ncbi:ethylbenzene dehydrogenase-related protein [Halostella salina]|uniref:ethylbenzene dehydrogenase-related protein n=1 Tax=Halostella salina TaxID=1547897 RepID=UPI000EF8301A
MCLMMVGQVAFISVVTAGHQEMTAVDRVPAQPDAGQWADAPTRNVTLSEQQMALPHGGGTVDEMTVQSVTNDTHVAFRLEWEDPTRDTNISEPGAYSDAAAIMLRGGSKPPITMGASGDPVDIWYWRASWQFAESDPGGDMYTYPHPDNRTKPGRAAGNPLSKSSYDRFAQNYYARGYGSLSHAPSQTVAANAERTVDGWSVVFVRERGAEGQFDAAFDEADQMYLAFAVWNGSADEVNGQKSITLRYTVLDTENGELSAAQAGGGGSGDGGDGGGAAGAAGDAGDSAMWLARSATNWVTALVLATAAAWLVSYWRLRR